ncbi:MAG TPA: aminoacyl-tRNA hydrolase, partial [Verrucomicrobiae bacterium]|nr:aminoacyl-tRNA hydrolase [Verrucomicrobiae bacterium]
FTRHNVGFMFADYFALKENLSFRGKFQALFCEIKLGNSQGFLVKPQTYMNLSGRSIREIINWYKLSPQDVIVVYDDLDLPLGKIRIRPQGGAGGHNGIKSIISELGTDNFPRIKIGIGRPPEGWDPADYVLSNFRQEELTELKPVLIRAWEAARELADEGLIGAMNKYNR